MAATNGTTCPPGYDPEFRMKGFTCDKSKFVGEGKFGKVFWAEHEGRKVMYKEYKPQNPAAPFFHRAEAQFASLISNLPESKEKKSLAEVIGWDLEADGTLALISVPYNGGDLSKAFASHQDPTKSPTNIRAQQTFGDMLDLFIRLAKVNKFLHQNNIVHRHMHGQNVLMHYPEGTKAGETKLADIELRVADLKLSLLVPGMDKNDDAFIINEGPMKNKWHPVYTPPEDFRHFLIHKETDIYWFGCLMCELLMGQVTMFADHAAWGEFTAKSLLMDYRLKPCDWFPLQLKVLMQHCWQSDWNVRPQNFDDVIAQLEDIKSNFIGDLNTKLVDVEGDSNEGTFKVAPLNGIHSLVNSLGDDDWSKRERTRLLGSLAKANFMPNDAAKNAISSDHNANVGPILDFMKSHFPWGPPAGELAPAFQASIQGVIDSMGASDFIKL